MSRFGQVEMSQSRPPELRALRCGDGKNGGDDHDEHARGRSCQDGAGPWSTECCRSGWRRSGWGLADVNSSGCGSSTRPKAPRAWSPPSAVTRATHQLAPGAAERALRIIRDRYADFGPTLACEKLRECHGLVLA